MSGAPVRDGRPGGRTSGSRPRDETPFERIVPEIEAIALLSPRIGRRGVKAGMLVLQGRQEHTRPHRP